MKLFLFLGDQLNVNHSWFKHHDENAVFIMAEMQQEAEYVRHHAQKILGFFAAMRTFSEEQSRKGFKFHYIKIGTPESRLSLTQLLEKKAIDLGCTEIHYQLPDEYRLRIQLQNWARSSSQWKVIPHETEHFLISDEDLAKWQSQTRSAMEFMYRKLRKQYGILMNGDKPMGEKWNFDHDNRNPYKGEVPLPSLPTRKTDLSVLWNEILEAKIPFIGSPKETEFIWATSRSEAIEDLNHFCQALLPYFGRYQDAITEKSPFLFHSRLSMAMNMKLISPLEVVTKVEDCYKKDPQRYSLSAVEGFIRQVVGWREFMRLHYWVRMPELAMENRLLHKNPLPDWFWTGNTRMRCLSVAIKNSLEYGYAHHIQRLMITGNYALLAGIDPTQVDEWYLGIYVDAIEWVQLPNTRGMSQFAEGGQIATKPYVSTARYIQKMSDHCKNCNFDPNVRFGANACPFNGLYWAFYERNRSLLSKNPRILAYRQIDAMSEADKQEISQLMMKTYAV